MNLLAFESSTKIGSVALIQDGHCTIQKFSPIQKSHSEVLHLFAADILKSAGLSLNEIDCFAAGCGPGSFTGIRVALNAAKAFSYALKKPLVAVDSLANLAHLNQGLVQKKNQSLKILSLINAYKNMSYYGLYDLSPDKSLAVLKGPSVIPMKDIKILLDDPVLTVGDGYLVYEKFIPETLRAKMLRIEGLVDDPSAESLGVMAYGLFKKGLTLDWKSAKPLYIRSSEAEETKRGIVWSPLDFKE